MNRKVVHASSDTGVVYNFDHRERVLTATWKPRRGVKVNHSDVPDPWLVALERLGRDLSVRQYGGAIEFIDWAAEYDQEGGFVWLYSSVTIVGQSPGGLACSGVGARVDADAEGASVSMADLVQNEIAEVGTAWPWGEDGGFMNAVLIDGIAKWRDRRGRTTPIGHLTE